MMKILALELSSSLGSIAFLNAGAPVFVRQFAADRKDSGLFYENLSALREACGLPKIIVVGLGPGSYAGVRIALATALGLRAAASARLVGVPSICAFDRAEYGVIGDARRNSFFFALVRQGACVAGPILLSETELRAKLGEHAALPFFTSQTLPQFPSATLAFPSAQILARLAPEITESDEPLEPIYLRPPHITTSKTVSWIR